MVQSTLQGTAIDGLVIVVSKSGEALSIDQHFDSRCRWIGHSTVTCRSKRYVQARLLGMTKRKVNVPTATYLSLGIVPIVVSTAFAYGVSEISWNLIFPAIITFLMSKGKLVGTAV